MKDGQTVGIAIAIGLVAALLGHTVGVTPLVSGFLIAACFASRMQWGIIAFGASLVRDVVAGISPFTLVRLVGILVVLALLWRRPIRPRFSSLALSLAIASPAYHLALAVGDWITQICTQYPRSVDGLLASITASLPYFYRSFMGELLVIGVFAAGYALVGSSLLGRRQTTLSSSHREL